MSDTVVGTKQLDNGGEMFATHDGYNKHRLRLSFEDLETDIKEKFCKHKRHFSFAIGGLEIQDGDMYITLRPSSDPTTYETHVDEALEKIMRSMNALIGAQTRKPTKRAGKTSHNRLRTSQASLS